MLFYKDFPQNYNYDQNEHRKYCQDREAGYEPYQEIYGRYFQLIDTAAESFLDADRDGVRVGGGQDLDFLYGEVDGAVYNLVIQGAQLGL